MERFWHLTALFSFYGALLTEKQQACLRLHLDEDFSLSEIGEELGRRFTIIFIARRKRWRTMRLSWDW